ncbi:hypothetical protein D0544_03020 [Aestuariirhabdus litorea]|uniref:Uncharacterized protein n=2 Tax=Aestuariirhabdus litorea TaxID=2528527 RepID=A0A3P3VXL7_9GAMM|nr:hypothetical protein D0544_03020 [Aestuariirhabdus litorea]RWW98647.1 hypothetical protein DZC74_03015 [Endozoicomonadaceae bacterium GTF-13]
MLAGLSQANEPEPLAATISAQGAGLYRISLTLRHADEGWDHYADRWELVDEQGNLLATRRLQHPHVDEQPFTRSLSAVRLPQGLEKVTIRVHDSRHGYGRRKVTLEIPR